MGGHRALHNAQRATDELVRKQRPLRNETSGRFTTHTTEHRTTPYGSTDTTQNETTENCATHHDTTNETTDYCTTHKTTTGHCTTRNEAQTTGPLRNAQRTTSDLSRNP